MDYQHNRLRERIEGFAHRVKATIDQLDFDQRQKLLRLVVYCGNRPIQWRTRDAPQAD